MKKLLMALKLISLYECIKNKKKLKNARTTDCFVCSTLLEWTVKLGELRQKLIENLLE